MPTPCAWESTEPARLAALVLAYQRDRRGLSRADVARKLRASSRSAYARYEQGAAMPTFDEYIELLAAVAPDMALTLEPRIPGGRRRRARAKGAG